MGSVLGPGTFRMIEPLIGFRQLEKPVEMVSDLQVLKAYNIFKSNTPPRRLPGQPETMKKKLEGYLW